MILGGFEDDQKTPHGLVVSPGEPRLSALYGTPLMIGAWSLSGMLKLFNPRTQILALLLEKQASRKLLNSP